MDARTDWASLMVWSNATGSNVALRSERVVFASVLTASFLSTRSQGVAGELECLTTVEPLRVFSTGLKESWK